MGAAERLDITALEPDAIAHDVLAGQLPRLDSPVDGAGIDPEQLRSFTNPQGVLVVGEMSRLGTHYISAYLIQRIMPMPFIRRTTADTSRLAEFARAEADARQLVINEVARLRAEEGASWLDIAEALGTQRQNAHRKFKDYRWDPKARHAVLEDWDPPAGKY